ncbi:MAG: DUF4366 domain-containing protein [Planctomycetes bacterium]|nr:DUF4366 domain-containing protein [Planctomycetota bacterium]
MKLRGLIAVSVLLLSCLAFPTAAPAAEMHLEFVEGLRDRDYLDLALAYLEQLEKRTDVSAEIKAVIPYEKAKTLVKGALALRTADAQMKQLDQARTYLEEFIKANPGHAESGAANAELAQIVVLKGDVELQQSRAPGNAAQKAAMQKRARAYYNDAKAVWQAAYDGYKEAHGKFDKFIPQNDKRRDAREEVFNKMVHAQLQLAVMMYKEGQTYDRGTPENKDRLVEAAKAFDTIHAQYRQLTSGLYARMWEAKCFEEQDAIGKALGFYAELLGHGNDLPVAQRAPQLRKLQNMVLHFRLICLNHEKKKDYQVAIQEGDAWLKENRNLASSSIGLGIQWEMVRAMELLSRQEETNESEKTKLLQQALEKARYINRFPGEYKDASTAMIQKLMVGLNREPGDPKDFTTAFGVADNMKNDISRRLVHIREAQGSEQARLLIELQPILKEAARILQIGLSVVGPKDDQKDVNRARFYLAYFYYYMRDSRDLKPTHALDAAIVAEFTARKLLSTQPDHALDAAFLAQAAYILAYTNEQPGLREAEIKRVIGVCNFITENWPTNDKANDARMDLGKVYTENHQPAEAARWYLQVPETAPQYLEAQLAAGNAWWYSFQSESIKPEAERKPKAELDAMVKQSQDILKAALTKFESQLPGEITQVDASKLVALTTAKANYASILNGTGDYKAALEVLTAGKLSVLNAVAAPDNDDQKRPAEGGIKSRRFAGWVYGQVLLRAYVGLQDLDNARVAMKKLEGIVGSGGGGASVTRVYLELGRELEKEVHRLQAARDPRLNDVLKSFETFLEDMFKRQEGHDYNTLNWIADTYSNLGDGLQAGDPAKAESYFGKSAAAVQFLLESEASKPGVIPQQAVLAVKLKLVKAKRRQKSFDAAHQLLVEILKEKSKAVDVQEEAAQVFQDWGAYGGDINKFEVAVLGGKKATRGKTADDTRVWGWAGLAEKLQTNLQTNPKPEYERQFLDASYNAALCWYKYAQASEGAKQRKTLIRESLTAIKRPRALLPQLGGIETWGKYNTLYRQIQQMMLDLDMEEMQGKEVADLERTFTPEEREAQRAAAAQQTTDETDTASETADSQPKSKKKKDAPKAKKPADSGNQMALIIAIVVGLILVGGGGAYYFLVLNKKPKARRRVVEDIEDPFATSPPATPKVKSNR